MLIEIYFTKVTKGIFPNSVLTSIISRSLPMQTNKLIETTNPIWHKYQEHKSLSFIFFIKKNYFRPFREPKLTTCPLGKLVTISTCPTRFLVAPGNRATEYFEPCRIRTEGGVAF